MILQNMTKIDVEFGNMRGKNLIIWNKKKKYEKKYIILKKCVDKLNLSGYNKTINKFT